MKLEIVSKQFNDKSTESIIIKSFEYFITMNKEKYENLPKKDNGKKDLSSLLESDSNSSGTNSDSDCDSDTDNKSISSIESICLTTKLKNVICIIQTKK